MQAADVDEVIVANAIGPGGNPARSTALSAGLPERVAGLTLDRQCAGGMDAPLLARQMILSGDAKVVIAGGVESYSRRPLRMRTFADGRAPEAYDQAPFTPWPDNDPSMTKAADDLAQRLGVSRTEQDAWAIESHRKALAHHFPDKELTRVEGVDKDAFARKLTRQLCARAQSIAGTITAANTAVAADAAAFCVVVSGEVAARAGGQPVALLGGATLGGDPTCPGLAPIAAITETLTRTGRRVNDLVTAEIMEAFAVQAIACVQETGLEPAHVNLGGGALARGHPIGASGAINAVRLYHELCASGGTGLAAIAAAGGIGTALLLEA